MRVRTLAVKNTYSRGKRNQFRNDAHRVLVEGIEVALTPLEFKLLGTLYENRPRVQSREALIESVWGMEVGEGTRTVDAHVKRLRDKLGNAGWYVQTVRGLGYRFTNSPGAGSSLDDG